LVWIAIFFRCAIQLPNQLGGDDAGGGATVAGHAQILATPDIEAEHACQ
jgi:hypothetical protein